MENNRINKNIKILYEDNHIIVADKGVGILSQQDDSKDDDMLTLLKAYIKEKYKKPGDVFLGLVQRLDTVTSGVMVFARTSKAASRLSDSIRKNEVEKKYLAVIEDDIAKLIEKSFISAESSVKNADAEKFDLKNTSIENISGKDDKMIYRLEDYLLKDAKKNLVSVTADKKNGKRSVLDYEIIKQDMSKKFTLVRIHLLTGRSHQIRVQFSSRGCPVAGDMKYGSKTRLKRGIALHAYELSFPHPTKKDIMTFKTVPERYPFNLFSDDIKDHIKSKK